MFSMYASQICGWKSSGHQQSMPKPSFEVLKKTYYHQEFKFKSSRDATLVGSFFGARETPTPLENDSNHVVILMCGNQGDRSTNLHFLNYTLPKGINLACFDYNGRGTSDPLPVSYGLYEHRDLAIFVI